MTTLQSHKFTCPLCGSSFESRLVTSTDSFGRHHSDLYKEAEGEQPVCYFVHTCPGCGYTGYEATSGLRGSTRPSVTRWRGSSPPR